jgi:crotonobetainyl-CoA:carnitine CoA-transferase CaiB-like acyl-CoA transferase
MCGYGVVTVVSTSGGLAGVRVVDFGHFVAGPLLGVLLANEGADVIHVDPPGVSLHPSDAFLNRGKRRLTLDLKDKVDLGIAKELVSSADVLIENFRPGVMDRLGLGWDSVENWAPHLVYCSLPGFAPEDPRACLQAWEGTISAATASCSPGARDGVGEVAPGDDTEANRPRYTAIPIASNFAAFLAGTLTVAALSVRDRTGRGQKVEVPLFHAMFEAIGAGGAYAERDGITAPFVARRGGSGTYRCADGRYVMLSTLGATRRFLRWLADVAGITSWGAEGLTAPRLSPKTEARLYEELTALFATRPSHEWEELAAKAGIPLIAIRSGDEWLQTDHAISSRAVTVLNDPEFGETRLAGLPIRTAANEHLTPQPRHVPDEDRAEILRELQNRAPAPRSLAPTIQADVDAAPFDGMRVIDLTEILAGPTSGRILGELGAEVIKINSPRGEPACHGLLNRGKQSLLLDVQSEGGQEVFWQLASDADVVIQNYRPGSAERYGIGYEHAKAHNPDIIYVSVSCYGPGGDWETRRGYEYQGQAATGIMDRAGGDGPPDNIRPYPICDYGTGALASFAASLALYHRQRTGDGQHTKAALANTGTYHQASYLLDYASKDWDVPAGRTTLGTGPMQRFYRANDGWFFLGLNQDCADSLSQQDELVASVREIIESGTLDTDIRERALERLFLTHGTDEWVTALQTAGVGAHATVELRDLMLEPLTESLGLSIAQISDDAGPVRMPGLAGRMSRSRLRIGEPARQPGADAQAVLSAIGIGDRVDYLARAWALRTTDLPPAWPQINW